MARTSADSARAAPARALGVRLTHAITYHHSHRF
jgi:hypothetical protein